ncbi:MAG: DUF1552 domain-containing protein [Planctomycetota bacterium]
MKLLSKPLSRRTLLRGVGVSLALPCLEAMTANSYGSGTVEKKVRLAYLYFPNGVANGAWEPERVGRDGRLQKLNRYMKSLEPFLQDITIPQQIWTPRGNGHGSGTATWLTGHGYDGREINAGGISVDQMAAKLVGDQTLLPSLELSTRGEGFFSNSLPRNTISWADSSTPMPRETEPRVIFDRMFRVAKDGFRDRSVLDAVLEDARELRRRVGTSDHRKLDEYLESVRAIEKRIQFSDRQAKRASSDHQLQKSLVRPADGVPADHREYMRLMFDMMTLAFWSDATRVSTFMLDHGQSNRYFNFIDGVRGTWHALSHWKDASGRTDDDDGITSWDSPTQKRHQYNLVTQWHHEQVAYFLGRLKQIREPDGSSLLDNSTIVYGSNLADGHVHEEKNLPILIAGRGGGSVNSGRLIKFRRDTSMSDLHLSMLRQFDESVERFADSNSPMTELES